jgi:hypothetical protein
MSIGPIQSFPPPENTQAVNPTEGSSYADARPGSGVAVNEAAQPVSGTLPKQETSTGKNASSSYELPEDVVEVHQDPETKDRVIFQFLDKAKNVILQVPSSGELSVERGIAQDLQAAAKLRATVSTATGNHKRGKTHGD